MQLRVFADSDAVAAAAADVVAAWLRLAPEPVLGLAGGSTPRSLYERLSRTSLPWHRVHLWMTDERFVPADHDDSNQRMARGALADHVPATFHAVPILEDAPASAAAYETAMAPVLPPPDGPPAGMVVLGLGDDGHTASLFPGGEAMRSGHRGFAADLVPQRGWRLTATIPLLAAARRTVFLVTGPGKAEAVEGALAGHGPAAQVAAASHDVIWMLDRAAAARL